MVYFEKPLEKLRTVVVFQITLKTLGPTPALYTSSFDEKCKSVLLSRRSAEPPLTRSPIRRNRSNRIETGPGCVPCFHRLLKR